MPWRGPAAAAAAVAGAGAAGAAGAADDGAGAARAAGAARGAPPRSFDDAASSPRSPPSPCHRGSERCGEHMHARRVIRGTQRTGRRGARIGSAIGGQPPSAARAVDESDPSGASSESPTSAVVSTCMQGGPIGGDPGRSREIRGDCTWSVEREPSQRRRGALEARARPIVLRSAACAPDEGAHQWCDQHAIKWALRCGAGWGASC